MAINRVTDLRTGAVAEYQGYGMWCLKWHNPEHPEGQLWSLATRRNLAYLMNMLARHGPAWR